MQRAVGGRLYVIIDLLQILYLYFMSQIDGALYTNGTASAAISDTPGILYGIIINSHTSGTIRFNDGASGTTSAGVKATGVLTASGVFTAGEAITIGDVTYTMVATLTGAAYEVLIGASAAASLDNLKLAINAAADSGQGTLFGAGTPPHHSVTATTNTDTAQTIEAVRVGTYANSIATTETAANAAWGAATMASGAEPSLAITNTHTFAAGSQTLNFPHAIRFNKGLYLTVGGTIDYTVIHRPN